MKKLRPVGEFAPFAAFAANGLRLAPIEPESAQEDLRTLQSGGVQPLQPEAAGRGMAVQPEQLAPIAPSASVVDLIALVPAAELAGVSRQALNTAILAQRLPAIRKLATSGRNANRPYWEIRLADLFQVYPAAQARYEAQQAAAEAAKAAEARTREVENARRAAQAQVVANGDANPQARSRTAQAKAWHVTRYSGLLRETGAPKKRGLALYMEAVRTGQIEVPDWVTRACAKLSERSLERWTAALEQGGTAALEPRHAEANQPLMDAHPELGEYTLSMLAHAPHLRPAVLAAALKAQFPDLAPSTPTVARWVERWKVEHPEEWLLLVNPDKHKSKYQVALGSRSEHLSRPNELWETDATKVDVIFSDEPKRWLLLGLVDVYTDRRLFMLVERGSGREHGRLLREAILRWGWPDAVRTDNGSDYTSDYMTRLFADLQIAQILCAPFSGEEKPHVERGFGVLQNDLVELLPGFCGHSVSQGQDIRARKTFAERLFKRTKDHEDRLAVGITRAEFQAFLDQWMQADMDRVRSKRSHIKGRSPRQVLEDWQAKGEAPLRVCRDTHLLDYLLLPVVRKKVGKKGIEHQGRFYAHELVGAHVGERVECRVNPENLGNMSVFDSHGAFLFVAQCLELQGINAQEVAVQARIHQKHKIKAMKASHRALRKLTSPFTVTQAILAERQQVRPGVSPLAPSTAVITETLAQAAEAHAAEQRAVAEAAKAPPKVEQLPFTAEQTEAIRAAMRPKTIEESPLERYLRLSRQPVLSLEDREWVDWFLENTEEGRGIAAFRSPNLRADLA